MFPRQFTIAVSALLIAGCQNFKLPTLPVIAPYRIDIQQGNLVTQEMVAKLQPGMTRGQVRYVLGTPLVTDVFHSDRWDYVYSYEKAGKMIEQRRIVAVFNGDKLVRIEGDVVPAGAKPTVSPAPGAATAPTTGNSAAAVPAEQRPAASATPTPEAGAASSPAATTVGAEPASGDNAGRTAGPGARP